MKFFILFYGVIVALCLYFFPLTWDVGDKFPLLVWIRFAMYSSPYVGVVLQSVASTMSGGMPLTRAENNLSPVHGHARYDWGEEGIYVQN